MATPLLEVRNLEITYHTREGDLTAVRNGAFDVQEGEIVGIVGESGCGKSSIAAATMRLLPPNGRISKGEILFRGRNLRDCSQEELRLLRGKDISMIFQDPMTSLNPVFNIETQMLEILRAHNGRAGGADLRGQALAMLERVGIPDTEERIKAFPHQFSGGMRQRIMIAMALMCRPALLIADEPTSALDVTLEAQILELIRNLRDELGTSILYISHDLGVIAQLCDRVIVMYAGNIVEKADCFTLFEHPRHPYTRALLACHPSRKYRSERLAAIPGRVPSLKDLPIGCKFAERCDYAQPLCHTTEPDYRIIEGSAVLCHQFDPGTTTTAIATPAMSKPAPSPIEGAARPHSNQVLLTTQGLKIFFAERTNLLERLARRTPGYVRAVDGVEINIRRGETIGLVGESGSGKTTLGKTVLRLENATSGHILFDGQDITHLNDSEMRPLRARMQMIFQDPVSSLSPRMKVATLLMEPFRHHGIAVDPQQEVLRLLEMVGLSVEQADKYPHELSGGQARRVGIARALALNPEFLVADEPTAGLDVSVAASILNLLKDLREELGLTYLIITHNLNMIGFISNRIGVMYLGKLVELGPTVDLFERPAHPYTEALISAISEPDPAQRHARRGRVLLTGEIPSPKNPPPGCRFHPRCRYAEACCRDEEPELRTVEVDRLSACHFPERVQRAR